MSDLKHFLTILFNVQWTFCNLMKWTGRERKKVYNLNPPRYRDYTHTQLAYLSTTLFSFWEIATINLYVPSKIERANITVKSSCTVLPRTIDKLSIPILFNFTIEHIGSLYDTFTKHDGGRDFLCSVPWPSLFMNFSHSVASLWVKSSLHFKIKDMKIPLILLFWV